jgi:hypothetical protein
MVSWAFTNSGSDFRISRQGSGTVEFRVDNDGNAILAGNLQVGGTVTELSDRDAKHAIEALDVDGVLERVARLPVSEWSYRGEPANARHIGPMAQDFHAAFGLAGGETGISARDMAGVNMAAIQALVGRMTSENRALEKRNAELEARVLALESQGESTRALLGALLEAREVRVAQR